MRGWAAAVASVLMLTGCGLGPSGGVKDIDPLSLPPRLLADAPPTAVPSRDPDSSGAAVYFLRDTTLRPAVRTLTARTGVPALQELLNSLAAGPDGTDRQRGVSTALPPTTRLTVTGLEGDLATVDLSFGQVPPDQTTAIAQIVLTATSLPEVNRLLLTIEGAPLQAPLANGAQTDRPLTRSDYVRMLRPS
ncbi:hypothetical protein GCM10009547_43370 [Sporichthya brevicatena]|uniref:GerMN domain-containing protein n=1 Tax=Sporichthya brevicatena TaxID=171442 RepID=A0ABP3SF79_9ACTN